MADLITHTCVALLWKCVTVPGRVERAGWRLPPSVATFVFGTCLPDLLARVPAMGLEVLSWSFPIIPVWAVYFWSIFHVPFGIVMCSLLVAQAFGLADRSRVFRQLVGGGLLHLAVDVLQTHLGTGYILFFPFSTWDWELGLIGSEDTVRIVPVLLPLTVGLCWWRWGRAAGGRRRSCDRPGPLPPSRRSCMLN